LPFRIVEQIQNKKTGGEDVMNWYLIEASVNFIQVYVIFKVFDLYYEQRFQCKYALNISILFMTLALCLLNYLVSIELNPYAYLCYILLIYAFSLVIFKGSIFSNIITTFLIIVIIGICELVSALLISAITGIEINSVLGQVFGRFEAMIISHTFLIFIYLFIKKGRNRDKMILSNNRYYLLVSLLLFLTVFTIIIVIWIYGNVDINESLNTNLVLLTICISSVSLLSIILTDKIIKEMNERHKNELELQHMKLEHTYFSDVNSVLEEIRILRHDMRGELVVIHGYNEMNQRDKISTHIEKKLRELDIQLLPRMDNDNILTSFINFKIKEARSHNIEVMLESNLTEEDEINIDKEDICRVLNNIINNAIEACEHVEGKYIKLQIDMVSNCLIIKAENPFKGEVKTQGDKLITLKKDKARHGYGLKSVKGIAEKYGGFMNINYGNNIFILEVHMIVKM